MQGFDPTLQDAHDYPRDFVVALVNFVVPSISMALTEDGGRQSLFKLTATNLTMGLSQHPKNATVFTVEVSAVQLQDFVTKGPANRAWL